MGRAYIHRPWAPNGRRKNETDLRIHADPGPVFVGILRRRHRQREIQLAEKFYNQKNYPSAIAGFKDLVQNYPFSPHYQKSLYDLARCYFETKDYESASRFFSLSEKKSVKDTDKRISLFGLGEVFTS